MALLDTSKKLELIQDVTYKKLRHMLDMRNDTGISHPNDYTINAFELMGWLETCVQVLNDRPTGEGEEETERSDEKKVDDVLFRHALDGGEGRRRFGENG